MNKKQFLATLKSRLQILDEKEVEDILREYEDHIDQKIKNGQTEEEAIISFGSIDELVKKILSAYKISDQYQKPSKVEEWINFIVDKIVAFFHDFSELLSTQKGEDIIRIVFKVLIILLFIWLLKLPFYLIEGIGRMILRIFPYTFYHAFGNLFGIFVRFSYLVVAILLLYFLVKRLVEEERPKEISKGKEKVSKKKSREEKKVESKKLQVEESKDKKENYAAMMFQPFFVLIKILVVIITLPIWACVIGLAVLLGLMICFLFQGVYMISFICIVLGLLLMGCALLGFIYHLAFRKGGNQE